MCGIISHRGPDGEGHYADPDVSLGHKRLSIIDIESGKQPIFNEDGNIVLIYNGEIYNYHALREELKKDGHTFYTETDSEVIVHLYEKYGADCVNYLSGMFAFALWNRAKRELFLARDRMGIKPLYYFYNEGFLIFASEIKSLLLWKGIERKFNHRSADALLTYKHIPGDETLFEGIKKLLPGSCLVYKNAVITLKRYWSVEMETAYTQSKDYGETFYVEHIRRMLDESVRNHMVSDVPIGATLSGGLDSSLMVALMSRYSSGPVRTFSIGFGDANDELYYADLVARHFKTQHTEFREDCENFFNILPSILWHTEEPITGALVPTYYLAKKASEHVKVLLVGEGADELFAGYVRFKTLIPPFLPAKVRTWAYLRGLNSIGESEKRLLYTEQMRHSLNGDAERILRGYFALKGNDRINKMLKFEQECQLPNHQLLRVDKLTMAFSVEARVPFLDHKLVEFANTIPSRYKLRGLNEKYILKKAARDIVPEAITARRKQGMSSPITLWFKKGLKEIAFDFLSQENIEKRGYFKQAFIQDLLKKSESNNILSFPEFKINMLIMLELWHRIFIDPVSFTAHAGEETLTFAGKDAYKHQQ
ncbi:MAG: asparagine synthase (glutamine-hydrolyzing) [Nitrospirae bacterium]|nr:asparagine synthase (glutamine-hydrolyzing) [Nitrospirota bacterium]